MAMASNKFNHLPLPLVEANRAKLIGGGKSPTRETLNKMERRVHTERLRSSAQQVMDNWSKVSEERAAEGLPVLPPNIPILLEVEPDSDLDYLRSTFKFEIVAEHEDGIVIVASESLNLNEFLLQIEGFVDKKHGSATTAKLYSIFDDKDRTIRLERILSRELLAKWPQINHKDTFVLDVSIECLGHITIPNCPEKDDEYKKYFRPIHCLPYRMQVF